MLKNATAPPTARETTPVSRAFEAIDDAIPERPCRA
jgi:hypothetical protein